MKIIEALAKLFVILVSIVIWSMFILVMAFLGLVVAGVPGALIVGLLATCWAIDTMVN